jgi:hypothetical protein
MVVECDLRGRFGGIRNQGTRPTCIAFAVSDVHAALRPIWQPLSCEYIYYHAVNSSHKNPNNGVTFDSILSTLRTNGQPIEASWPYLKTLPSNLSTWRPPAGLSPLYRRDSAQQSNDLDSILDRLEQGVPLVIGMTISKSFFRPGTKGVIDANEPLEPHRRHAVIGLGFGRHNTNRVLLIRNSWGDLWGDGGYGWLSEQYLTNRLLVYAELTKDMTT